MKRIPQLLTALLLSIVSVFALADSHSQASQAYIDVSGQGEIEAFPDYLTLTIELSATADSVSKAKDETDKAFARISQIARQFKIDKKDIESVRISNYPQWQYLRDGKREFMGHKVVRPVTVKLRKTDNYGRLLEDLMDDDHLTVNSTQLGFDAPEIHQSKARRIALLSARSKAEEMAAVLDQKVTGVLWIQEQGGSFPHPVMMMKNAPMLARSMEADTGSEMQIQDQTITQSVQVRFQIAPK